MKIRLGFVSNSSSSSFCVVGKLYTNEELENLFSSEYIYDKIYSICENICINSGIETYNNDDYCIGFDIYDIKDNETLGDIKNKVLKEIQKFDKNADISQIQIMVDGGHQG